MRFRGPPSDQVVDAEVISAQPAPTVERLVRDPSDHSVATMYRDENGQALMADAVSGPLVSPETAQKARLISLFVKIPFLAYCAANGKVPSGIRLGAGLLMLWEIGQVATQTDQISALVPMEPT